jgi:mannose-6-phosphate isomerase-like protein (cupin superfamily)
MGKFTTRLQRIVAEVPEKINQFSVEEMTKRPAPDKWSKKEIIGHLCDSALHNWQRFTTAQNIEEPLKMSPYPQVELVRLNNYQNLPTGQLISLWANLNTQIIATVKNIPEEKLSHPIHMPEGALEYADENSGTLRWLIEDYLVHLEHHLRQIFPTEKTATPILPKNWNISTEAALKALAKNPNGKPFLTLLEHKKMYVEVYAPQKIDLQTPHDQDEIYVVISGTGIFFNNGEKINFGPGDLLFVPAGVEHRFEDFSEDFSTWVIFY